MAGQLSDAMRRANACRIDARWVPALTVLGMLPPTLPGASPNFPQRALDSTIREQFMLPMASKLPTWVQVGSA